VSDQPTPRTDREAFYLSSFVGGTNGVGIEVVLAHMVRGLERELAEQKAMTDQYVTRMGENLERAVKAERELAEATEERARWLDRWMGMVAERDQWREVAEELNQAADEISQDVEWPRLDRALAEFRKLQGGAK
jgi:hypothetical protein